MNKDNQTQTKLLSFIWFMLAKLDKLWYIEMMLNKKYCCKLFKIKSITIFRKQNQDDEIAKPIRKWMLHPKKTFRIVWDIILIVFVIWTCIFVPFDLAYNAEVCTISDSGGK